MGPVFKAFIIGSLNMKKTSTEKATNGNPVTLLNTFDLEKGEK